jgi:[acyl-carrier-protein] S-malonyltransferase
MKDALVFPGQGSQRLGMQADLADAFPVVAETWGEACDVLGFDIWSLAQEGPAEKLGETTVTQPAMLAAGVAAWRAWLAAGGALPVVVSGHSLGEYSALVAAESMNFADAMRVVKRRSELMQAAVPSGTGGMAAVLGLGDDAVVAACKAAAGDEVVEAVNFNAPGQVVIAGHRAAVDRAVAEATKAGAKRAVPLPVSVPSHSSLLSEAGIALGESLAGIEIGAPKIRVIGAMDAQPYVDADDIRRKLSRQVYSPVRWVETANALVAAGAERIVECGPGKVLAGLQRRIDRSVPVVALDSLDALRAAIDA